MPTVIRPLGTREPVADMTNPTSAPAGRDTLEYAAWLIETTRLELVARGLNPKKVDAAIADAVASSSYLVTPLSAHIKTAAMVDYLQASLGAIDEGSLASG